MSMAFKSWVMDSQEQDAEKYQAALEKLDSLGRFEADDEVGFFFKGVKNIQKVLNEFKIRKV